MMPIIDIENKATISRTTAGVHKYHGTDPVGMDLLRRYTRDVHAPAISRRPGIHLYRHFDLGPLRPDLLPLVAGVATEWPEARRLTGAGCLDYLDEAGLDAFYNSPDPEVRKHLLDDIHVLGGPPGRTTTYRTTGGNAHTYLDVTGDGRVGQGPEPRPRFSLFFRQRGAEDTFRAFLRALAVRWSRADGVLRLRLYLFDRPDMTVESNAGYPIFPAPVEEHYQAWMDVVLESESVGRTLMAADDGDPYSTHLSAVHVQEVPVTYTYVWDGKPTAVSLRGYPAYELIEQLGARNQQEPSLLRWMYGPVVDGRPSAGE